MSGEKFWRLFSQKTNKNRVKEKEPKQLALKSMFLKKFHAPTYLVDR
jgi:hypothetical protein